MEIITCQCQRDSWLLKDREREGWRDDEKAGNIYRGRGILLYLKGGHKTSGIVEKSCGALTWLPLINRRAAARNHKQIPTQFNLVKLNLQIKI